MIIVMIMKGLSEMNKCNEVQIIYIQLIIHSLIHSSFIHLQDFGQNQAIELEDQLHTSLDTFNVEIIKGRDYVQVRPSNVSKGGFVTEALRLLRRTIGCDIDFVMCLGDDQTDESMFEAVEAYVNEDPSGREAVGLDDD